MNGEQSKAAPQNPEHRRFGRFHVAGQQVRDNPAGCAQFFAALQFVPLRAEMMAHTLTIEYTGWSPHFDILAESEPVPNYDIASETDDAGNIVRVRAVRSQAS